MTSKFFIKAISAVFLTVHIAACAPTPASVESTPSPQVPQSENTNPCANALFPVVLGATWTYSSTGAPGFTKPFTFTESITEVRADGFTLTSQFPDQTRTQTWSCTGDGLLALQPGSGPAGGLNTSQFNLELTTSNVTGTTIPANITPGQTWTYGLDFEGEMEILGNQAEADGVLSVEFNAVGMENVTVPAGTFEGMKIQGLPVMDIEGSFSGITIPMVLTGISHVWMVPGVGWVKMELNGDLDGTVYSETITLQSFNIP